ncbi:hypothetical protein [Streptomyces sp. PRh5]|uniref:hypothetical protein n=1 Tax=Streptomyces sp. PRh5 TaxID=1158056 RepID=UPI0004ADC175|nr:hypothetical protein [Streptomyces sp. PRh5]
MVGLDPDPGRRTALAWAADAAFVESRHPRVRVSGMLAEGHPALVLRETLRTVGTTGFEPATP